MIGKLKGQIDSYGDDWVLLDVHGVCYQVFCAVNTLQSLPGAGEAATLAIETYVREDQIKLFGFASDLEREWFRLLMTVQGVGAKVALAILGVLKPGELATAIALKDTAQVSRAPGVGKKVAERICGELKDKAPAYADADPATLQVALDVSDAHASKPVADAVSALTNLGYAHLQASAAVAGARREAGEDVGAEVLIRLALKELSQ